MPKSKSKRTQYQPPPKPKPKPSPRWFGPLVLVMLFAGVLIIVLNYLGFILQTSNLWLWVGLGMIAVGFILATRWR